jgi:hypothetical protein
VAGVNGSTPAIVPLVVRVPGGLDTGIVFNDSTGFTVSAGGVTAPAAFIFATLVGTISGWAPTVPLDGDAQLKATVQGAVFTGLANLTTEQGSLLYAADFAGGRIVVFDSNWNLVPSEGGFRDQRIPVSEVDGRGHRAAVEQQTATVTRLTDRCGLLGIRAEPDVVFRALGCGSSTLAHVVNRWSQRVAEWCLWMAGKWSAVTTSRPPVKREHMAGLSRRLCGRAAAVAGIDRS